MARPLQSGSQFILALSAEAFNQALLNHDDQLCVHIRHPLQQSYGHLSAHAVMLPNMPRALPLCHALLDHDDQLTVSHPPPCGEHGPSSAPVTASSHMPPK